MVNIWPIVPIYFMWISCLFINLQVVGLAVSEFSLHQLIVSAYTSSQAFSKEDASLSGDKEMLLIA